MTLEDLENFIASLWPWCPERCESITIDEDYYMRGWSNDARIALWRSGDGGQWCGSYLDEQMPEGYLWGCATIPGFDWRRAKWRRPEVKTK